LRSLPLITTLLLALFAAIDPVAAQDPTPKIGPFVIDLHASIPRFPSDNQQLADSRGLLLQELPGRGLGLHAAAQVYFLKWKAVTFGVGADLTVAQAHQDPPQISADYFGRAVTERFTHVAPDISFNFGDGDGWSYLSGGIGPSTWSVVPDGEAPQAPDTEHLQTINYGGGARWFINEHVAFSADFRWYSVEELPAQTGLVAQPRTTLLVLSGGVALK
jgi:hypothetical protein